MGATPRELARWLHTLPRPEQRLALRARLRTDNALFCTLCHPTLVRTPWNPARQGILDEHRLTPPWGQRQGDRFASYEAPRGTAKTTLLKMVASWKVCTGREPYILIVSAGQRDSRKTARHLQRMFRAPSEMMEWLYGPFEVDGNIDDYSISVGGGAPVYVSARSWMTQVRGTNVDGQRPTSIEIDDAEKPARVRNGRLRDEDREFLEEDIGNAGPEEGGLHLVMYGTRLHPDSQTARNSDHPAWHGDTWRSFYDWPTKMDLWEECRRLWAHLEDPHRQATARAFYDEHQEAMDEGARVLDPASRGPYPLMVKLWTVGRVSFWKDFQNDPAGSGARVFDPDSFKRCRLHGGTIHTSRGTEVALSSCRIGVWLDPRASKELERNDYAALAVVARDPAGYRYVLKCDMQRDKPSEARARYWKAFEWLGPRSVRYAYEDNGFAALNDEGFDRERADREKEGKPWNLSPKGYPSTMAKTDRIQRIEPDVQLGWMEWDESLPMELWNQMRDFPQGAHDDGPDAIERADWLISEGVMPEVTVGVL